MSAPVLAARDVHVRLLGGVPIVQDVDLTLEEGEILGLVGESGSGKTTTALAMLGYHRPGVTPPAGSIRVAGEEMLGRPEEEVRPLRGRLVAYVPQDPASALNPALRIGTQIASMAGGDAAVVPEALRRVRLPSEPEFVRRFPHELSGGQKQRVAIAMAFAARPRVVILDEPTTGLDVVTQATVLGEVDRLRHELGTAMVYVSHDLAVVAGVADRVAVMYAGRIVELGPTNQVLGEPAHPYTRGLVEAVPDHRAPRRLHGIPGIAAAHDELPAGCSFAPRCPLRVPACEAAVPKLETIGGRRQARCLRWDQVERISVTGAPPLAGPSRPAPLLAVEDLSASHAGRDGVVVAARDLSFELGAGGCVALVGESGSGKTTVARSIVGLHEPDGGRVILDGAVLAPRAQQRPPEVRGRIQMVFQDPRDSLNPRMKVGDAIARPVSLLHGLGRGEAKREVARLLELVRLPAAIAARYPPELSGGERQRVAVARALAARPDVVVCDEITSSLDVSVQAAVLGLLADLRRELGLAVLFITHDLGVVATIADQVLVLDRGRLCEQGPVSAVLSSPASDYTRELLEAAPSLRDAA
jgi:peptide/nickel transport system ATP-binding protein